jgi:DnaA family protein
MAEQLVFELGREEPPSFDNFIAGPNAEVVSALRRFARDPIDRGLVLWGGPSTGKTHLLRASVTEAQARGRAAVFFKAPSMLARDPPAPTAMIAVDAIDTATASEQGVLFTLHNAVAAQGGEILWGSPLPPARLALRDDLRTRIGQGLVFEVLPLGDADLPHALRVYADERGFPLGTEVIDYLLRHRRRDLRSLTRLLAALDRYSLATHRAITVPLVKAWLGGADATGISSQADRG